jgi:hypothetical protein
MGTAISISEYDGGTSGRSMVSIKKWDWQSVINDGNELLCKADMLQFKELCDNNYMLLRG